MDLIPILSTFAVVVSILSMSLVESFFLERGRIEAALRTVLTSVEEKRQFVLKKVVVRYAILDGLRPLFPNHQGLLGSLKCY